LDDELDEQQRLEINLYEESKKIAADLDDILRELEEDAKKNFD